MNAQKNKTILVVILVILVLALLLNFALTDQIMSEDKETIKVGAMLFLSGEGAAWGQSSQRAIDLAVEEVNGAGGINGRMIEIIYEDTGGDTAKAVSAYKKLVVVDNVVAIIGPNLQTETIAISPLANEDDLPVIAPAYAPLSNRPNPKNPLMIWLDPTLEAEQMAEYVYSKNVRSVSVLGTKDSWEELVSTAFARKFEDLGGEIYSIELAQPSQDEVRTIVTKAISRNPDAVYLGTGFQFLNFGRILKELGYEGKIYSIEIDGYFASESKDWSSGVEFISSDSYKEEFREKYEAAYGEKSNIPSGQSYDAANILISFLKKSTERSEIVDMMEEFESYNGVSGQITITPEGSTIAPTAIYVINDGEISKIE